MSGYPELMHIHEPLVGSCIGYEDTFVSNSVSIIDYYPVYISFAILVMMLGYFEVIHWLWSCVLFADMGINFGIQTLIGDSDNIQPIACPIRQKQLPATGAELISVLWVTGLGILFIVRPIQTRTSVIVPLTTLGVVLLYTRIYLNFNTGAQMFIGAAVGTAEGVLYVIFIQYLQKWKAWDAIMAIPELTWVGKAVDTMTDSENPKICVDKPFETLTVLVAE
jgi:hypothetical protein